MWCSPGVKFRTPPILIICQCLPNCLDQAKPSMFADDNNISASAESVDELEEKLNADLSNIYQWLVANKLTLNVSKTEYMIISSQLSRINVDPTIKIGGESINRVKTTKSKKVSSGIGAIKLIKLYVPKDCLNQIYNALVQPYFDYCICSLVWQNCKLELQLKLQKLQNRAARVITGDNWEIRSKDVLSKLNW